MVAYRDLTAFRHAPWGGDQGTFWTDYWGRDLSSASFKWVFYYPDDRSVAFTLNDALPGVEGVSASYDAAAVHPSGAVVGKTRILPQVSEATLEGLTYDGVADLVLGYTLYCTPSGKLQFPIQYGSCTVIQGGPD